MGRGAVVASGVCFVDKGRSYVIALLTGQAPRVAPTRYIIFIIPGLPFLWDAETRYSRSGRTTPVGKGYSSITDSEAE